MKYRTLGSGVFGLMMMLAAAGCLPPKVFSPIVHLPTLIPSPIVVASPEIISHSPPKLIANTQVLKDAGCIRDKQFSYKWNCESNPQIMALGCEEVYPEELLAGLTPAYPVMGCLNQSQGLLLNRLRFYKVGCMVTGYASYILFKNGGYQLITYESELRSNFAPIESANEALGYAIVATNLVAQYDIESDPSLSAYKFFVKKYEDTHVDETSEGYVVHLFTLPTPLCFCGIHTTYLVDLLVTKDGRIHQLSSTEEYSVNACID